MLCMPLYGFMQGSFLLASQQHGTTMAARIGAAKVDGFRNS